MARRIAVSKEGIGSGHRLEEAVVAAGQVEVRTSCSSTRDRRGQMTLLDGIRTRFVVETERDTKATDEPQGSYISRAGWIQ